MKKRAALLLFVAFAAAVISATNVAAADADRLTQALADLRSSPNDPDVQARYLAAFPHDYATFLKLFELDAPLYDGYDYIEVLPALAVRNEAAVGKLLIGLSKDAHYEADAPSYLQDATAKFAAEHPRAFFARLKLLPSKKEADLIAFLADVENHNSYPDYQRIIDNAKRLGYADFARRFEAARAKRRTQPHG